MVHVKVFELRDILYKMFIAVGILVTSSLIISLSLKFIENESRNFAFDIVEDNMPKQSLNNKFKSEIIDTELGITKSFFKYKAKTEYLENENIYVKEESRIPNEFQENKYTDLNEIKIWNRPTKYLVNQLSNDKVEVGNTCLVNYSKLKLDFNELAKVSAFRFDDDTNILIVHTHTSEAYSEAGSESNFRTLDDNQNIVSVGKILKNNLLSREYNVTHSIIKHDTPSYNGSYNACLQTIQEEFKKQKYDIVLDIHRDALSGNLNFRPTTEIDGERVAKLMFVVGTNASGLQHDNWMENLKLALLIQNTANSMYPGLFRDLNLSKSRYNQHVCNGALIVEVGATGNTLDEVWNAMKYFSNVLSALKNKGE